MSSIHTLDDGYKSDSQCPTTLSNYNHQDNEEAMSSSTATSVVRNSRYNFPIDGKDSEITMKSVESDNIDENEVKRSNETHRIKTGKVVEVTPLPNDALLLTVSCFKFFFTNTLVGSGKSQNRFHC